MNTSDPVPAGIDVTRPHPARMYDCYLGGKDHWAADRQAAERVLAVAPEVRSIARANRAFLTRAVRYLAGDKGVTQFLDIGTGIPTSPNVHETAAACAVGTRVVYADYDRCKSGCSHAVPSQSVCLGVVDILAPLTVRQPTFGVCARCWARSARFAAMRQGSAARQEFAEGLHL